MQHNDCRTFDSRFASGLTSSIGRRRGFLYNRRGDSLAAAVTSVSGIPGKIVEETLERSLVEVAVEVVSYICG